VDHLDAAISRKTLSQSPYPLCIPWNRVSDTALCGVFLQVVFPQQATSGSTLLEDTRTTTISHTFAEYNTIITIYIVGPLSLLFLFRAHRTFEDENLSQIRKKLVFMILVCVQYTTFVVVRVDTIKGATHYLFTALTFVLILVYHALVSSLYDLRHHSRLPVIQQIKRIVAASSIGTMSAFAYIILGTEDVRSHTGLWTFACSLEIFAILLLGALDMLDVYTLGLCFSL